MNKLIFPSALSVNRSHKETLLGHKGIVIWLTGLSASGKSTIANALERELYNQKILTQVLDGDNVRAGISNNLGFSDSDRSENVRRIAEVAKLFANSGVVTICCLISPTNSLRNLARNTIGSEDYFEIYVNAPISVCERRDFKGLYKKARAGEIKDFTGIQSPFETPDQCDLEVRTDKFTPDQIVEIILQKINPLIGLNN